jgi:cysteinyl-tRNA synthetase
MALSILMSLSLTRRKHYGRLSGRNIEDMLANTRDLDGPDKRKPQDFCFGKQNHNTYALALPWSEGSWLGI